MPETNITQSVISMPPKKTARFCSFFRSFGHDARKDWLFLLCFSTCSILIFLTFAVLMYGRVSAEKVFIFENEPASLPSITVNVDALKQTIELFEQKKVKFNSIRLIGVDAFDPSL